MSKKMLYVNDSKKINTFFCIFLLSLSFNLIFGEGCKGISDLSDSTNCYNDVITFSHKNWRSGHAATNKEGEVIVEFSPDAGTTSSRLFYGLKKNGRYYFPGEPVYKQIDDMVCEDCTNDNKGRYESRVLFASLNSDTNKAKQYFFSMSTYYSLVELIDIENFTYYAWDTLKFFNLARPIFSYEYSLYEIEGTNTFIAAFIESAGFAPTKVRENPD